MRITTYRTELNADKHNVLVKEKSVNYNTCDALNNPETIANMLNVCFGLNRLAEEYVYLLALNAKNKPLGVFEVSHGTCDASLLNPREIFVRLLLVGASHFILVHNHPSGDVKPSRDDILITKKIKECSEMMGITFLDHIIIGDSRFSLLENGMM